MIGSRLPNPLRHTANRAEGVKAKTAIAASGVSQGEGNAMIDPSTLWSAVAGALGAAAGVIAKSLWDRYAGWQSAVPIETWKIRAHQLERRLSEFYWPLYARLLRDDVVWQVVFYDLRPQHDRQQPQWVMGLAEESRRKL